MAPGYRVLPIAAYPGFFVWAAFSAAANRVPHRAAGERGIDVVHSLGAEALLFSGATDFLLGMRGSYELNRHGGDDASTWAPRWACGSASK